jgi:hypothetical protein
MIPAIVGLEIKIARIEARDKSGQEVTPLDQMGCIRGFDALGTDRGRDVARSVELNMREDTEVSKHGDGWSRAQVLAEHESKGFVQGEKAKGKFGWYCTAV